MNRKKRNTDHGLMHHCYTRFHSDRNLLKSENGQQYFVEAVQMCRRKYDFELIAADIVSNYIHLVIRTLPEKEKISAIMQYIKSRVAEKFNRDTGSIGPFWNGRYGSIVIEETDDPEEYLKNLLLRMG